MWLGNALADQRIVVGRLDTEPRQHLVAKRARRLIDAIGDEDVVAGLHKRQQRC